MKSILTVNTELPGLGNYYDFKGGGSLSDHDIILFNPEMPHYYRHSYTDGSSSIDRVSGREAVTHLSHWSNEMREALKEGKTVFFLLGAKKADTYVTGVGSSTAKTTTYNTAGLSNYDAAPFTLNISNSKGSKYKVNDARFKSLFDALKENVQYEAYLQDETIKKPLISTHTGNKPLGAIYRLKEATGHLVILPYFDLTEMTELDKDGKTTIWTKEALGIGTKVVKALLAIDKTLTSGSNKTPTPEWVESIGVSEVIKSHNTKLEQVRNEIKELKLKKAEIISEIEVAKNPQQLLFETGTELEHSIESFLKSLGYQVTNFRDGALEIDHIIISPEGKRFIGEAEGKDNAAVNITKFRQLESNINEDFERDEVSEPALGILFGNGYRLKKPADREPQFTEKCLINAKRLSTVLVQTSDLYPIAMYLQDHPKDEVYKKACRNILESAVGEVAVFPPIPSDK